MPLKLKLTVYFLIIISCVVVSTELTHGVAHPAFSTAVVFFVLALKHQMTLSIELLSGPVEFSINVCPMEDTAVFIRIHPLTLQSIIYIVTLQGTERRRGRKKSTAVKL